MAHQLTLMNPVCERSDIWPRFQHELVLGLRSQLKSQLDDQYTISIANRTYEGEPVDDSGAIRTSYSEYFLNIYFRADKLAARFDFLSPTNKLTKLGKHAYLVSRSYAEILRCDIVEIELVQQGDTAAIFGDVVEQKDAHSIVVSKLYPELKTNVYSFAYSEPPPLFSMPIWPYEKTLLINMNAVLSHAYTAIGLVGENHSSGEVISNRNHEPIILQADYELEPSPCEPGFNQAPPGQVPMSSFPTSHYDFSAPSLFRNPTTPVTYLYDPKKASNGQAWARDT